jgi:hypothetical protein
MENLEQAQVTTTDGVGGEAPAPQPQPELTITDLQNLRAIIDTAARRGAFPASEMQAVGSVFDRLNKFLEVVTPQTPDQSQTPTA